MTCDPRGMSVCVCPCVCTHVHPCVYVCCVHMHPVARVCVPRCACTCICALHMCVLCMYVQIHERVCLCVCVRARVCLWERCPHPVFLLGVRFRQLGAIILEAYFFQSDSPFPVEGDWTQKPPARPEPPQQSRLPCPLDSVLPTLA